VSTKVEKREKLGLKNGKHKKGMIFGTWGQVWYDESVPMATV